MSINNNRSLLVAGVHKGGTTSLYKYLGDHPRICQPLKKELHFFTPLVYNEQAGDLETYFSHFNVCSDGQYLLDVSPSYFYGGSTIIKAIQELNQPKIILVLRDPVKRFVSFYKQGINSGRINNNMSFKNYIDISVAEFENFKNSEIQVDSFENRGFREGCYALYLKEWYNDFGDNLKIVLFDELVQSPKNVLGTICNWLDIEMIYDDYEFTQENISFTPKSQGLSKFVNKFFLRFEGFFRKNTRIKNFFKKIYAKMNRAEGFEPNQKDLNRLKELYKPYNKALNDIFKELGIGETNW